MRRSLIVGIVAFAVVAAALPAHAQSDDERYTIMRPEKGARPVQPEPCWRRNTNRHVVPANM